MSTGAAAGDSVTTARIAVLAIAAMLLAGASQGNFVDPDVWHEIALIRDAVARGSLPTRDTLAYTPTVQPVIHHEWGTGAILYALADHVGGAGLVVLKLLLTAAIAVGCAACVRLRGGPAAVATTLAPVAVFLSFYGFSTVRAQMFTMACTAWLLVALEHDRRGGRRWIVPWLALHVAWLNLHGGFVVGFVLLGLHALEQALRRRPARHLALVLAAMGVATLLNPYGTAYLPYLWNALLLDRPAVTEWAPVWHAPALNVAMFAMSLLVLAYAMVRAGPARLPGLLLVLCGAWAGMRHQRHLSLYAILWIALVPAFVAGTPLGAALRGAWERHARGVRAAWGLVGATCLLAALANRPWDLRVPANPGDHPVLLYPVGAVDYLDRAGFTGNLQVPFTTGAFVAWKLHPRVRISIDGRYEVAYPPGALAEMIDCYAARDGWERTLTRHPTDAVLVPRSAPLARALPALPGWRRAYQDDVYEVYLRPGLDLAPEDRRGAELVGRFP
jgi:hypothetical protein